LNFLIENQASGAFLGFLVQGFALVFGRRKESISTGCSSKGRGLFDPCLLMNSFINEKLQAPEGAWR
jgi:hypothetical protein